MSRRDKCMHKAIDDSKDTQKDIAKDKEKE